MSFSIAELPNITVPNGATESPVVKAGDQYDDAHVIGFISPAALNIKVSNDGVTFGTLQSGGADVALAAGKAIEVSIPFKFFKLVSAAAVVGDQVVQVSKRILL